MKRTTAIIISLILAISLMFSVPFVASAETVAGDADGSGDVTVSDARIVLRAAIGLENYTTASQIFLAGDVDGDNVITVSDARTILRAAIGLGEISKPDKPVSVPLSSEEIYNRAVKFTVEISVEGADFIGTGSGFFISSDGRIATNYHVIEDATSITVTDYSGKTYECTDIIGYNETCDVAIIKVDASGVTPAKLNYSCSTGATCYTLGSSLGLSYTFSNGVISSNRRELPDYNPGVYYIQTSAPISSGNSGGPLINVYGEVIGINSLSDEEGQNLNFAMPVEYLDEKNLSGGSTAEEYYASNYNDIDKAIEILGALCMNKGSYDSDYNCYTLSSTTRTLSGKNVCEISYYAEYEAFELSYVVTQGLSRQTLVDFSITKSNKGLGVFAKGNLLGYSQLSEFEVLLSGFTKESGFKNFVSTGVVSSEDAEAEAMELLCTLLDTVNKMLANYKTDLTVKDLGFTTY